MSTPSPLDEMRIASDRVWSVIAPGYVLTDEDCATMVRAERAMRASWMKKSKVKSVEREEARDAKKNAE